MAALRPAAAGGRVLQLLSRGRAFSGFSPVAGAAVLRRESSESARETKPMGGADMVGGRPSRVEPVFHGLPRAEPRRDDEHAHDHAHDHAHEHEEHGHSHNASRTQGIKWFGGHGHSHASTRDLLQAGTEARRITWAGIWVNVVLSGAKGVAGLMYSSSSLLADAVHSMSDLISDGVTLAALKFARDPPDASMPYGYGKFETVGALSVSALLMGGAGAIGLHSYHSLMELVGAMQSAAEAGETLPDYLMHPAALGIVVGSIISKEILYQLTVRIGKRLNSQVLIANAWHHRTDSMSSIVAFVGIGGSILGFPVLDPIGGMAVSALIMKMGAEIGWQSVQELLDGAPPAETLNELHAIVGQLPLKVSDIKDIRHVRARRMGPFLLVDMTVQFPATVSASAARMAMAAVSDTIRHKMNGVTEVTIRLEVENDDALRRTLTQLPVPSEQQLMKQLNELLPSIPEVEQITDLKRYYLNGKTQLQLQVRLLPHLTIAQATEITREVSRQAKQRAGVDFVQTSIAGAQTDSWGGSLFRE